MTQRVSIATFFSSITSVQGLTCWKQYYFLVYLMQQRSQGPLTLPKLVTNCGAPNQLRSDNAPKFKGRTWMTYLWKHQIQSAFTEAYHPKENPCEHQGGALKAAVIHCLTVTNVDLEFWCYCMEHMCLLQSVADCLSSTRMANVTQTSLWWCPWHQYVLIALNFGIQYGITPLSKCSPSLKCSMASSLVLQRTLEMLFASLFLLILKIQRSLSRSFGPMMLPLRSSTNCGKDAFKEVEFL